MAKDRVPIFFPPPTYPVVSLLAAWGLDEVSPLGAWPAWVGLVGALPLAASILAMGWAVAELRRQGTTVDPYQATIVLVAGGPYSWTRNPIYLGFLLAQAGLGLLLDLPWGLALLPATWLALRFNVVRKEEAYLEAKFGETYRAYKARVRRWL